MWHPNKQNGCQDGVNDSSRGVEVQDAETDAIKHRNCWLNLIKAPNSFDVRNEIRYKMVQ